MRRALLLVALAVGSGCTVDEPTTVTTAPTHLDAAEVPAILGTVEVHRAAPLPEPRTEVAGAAFDGRVVVVGGLRADGSASPRVDAYDPTTDRWEPLPDLPVALHHTAAVEHDGRLWVVGGYAVEGDRWVPQASTYSLGPDEDGWREETPLPEPRGALAAASTGGVLGAFGGVGPDGLSGAVFAYRDEAWQSAGRLSESREHLAAAAVGDQTARSSPPPAPTLLDRVYIIAGRTSGLDTNLDVVDVWDPSDASVVPGAVTRLTQARGGIGAATVGGAPCVAGGEQPTSTIASIECLGPGGWRVVADLTVPRHGLAVVALDGALHVVGGGPEPGLTVSGAHEVIRPARG